MLNAFYNISIHAPTRGATLRIYTILLFFEFQSTLPREERHKLQLMQSSFVYFNPRSHERSDIEFRNDIEMDRISIHAPTRGATYTCFIERSSMQFQSTLPREERLTDIVFYSNFSKFQSTLPREERQIPHRSTAREVIDFNPRSHERSDSWRRLQ